MSVYGDSVKLILDENTLLGYVNVWEPKSLNGERPRYSVSLIIKKDSPDMQRIGDAIKSVYDISKGILKDADGTVLPLNAIKLPVRDGDVEKVDNETYKNCYFINAYSIYAPTVVDENAKPITDKSQIYSGCYGRASINFYAFNSGDNCGIACSLNGIQKSRDGNRLGSKQPENDFKPIETKSTEFSPIGNGGDELPF